MLNFRLSFETGIIATNSLKNLKLECLDFAYGTKATRSFIRSPSIRTNLLQNGWLEVPTLRVQIASIIYNESKVIIEIEKSALIA